MQNLLGKYLLDQGLKKVQDFNATLPFTGCWMEVTDVAFLMPPAAIAGMGYNTACETDVAGIVLALFWTCSLSAADSATNRLNSSGELHSENSFRELIQRTGAEHTSSPVEHAYEVGYLEEYVELVHFPLLSFSIFLELKG